MADIGPTRGESSALHLQFYDAEDGKAANADGPNDTAMRPYHHINIFYMIFILLCTF